MFYVAVDTADECLLRIENRVKKGGHNIRTKDVVKRFENRFHSLIKILPYCDEVVFYDNNNGFVEVAEFKNGELITKTDVIPEWLSLLKDYLDENY